MSSDSHSAKTGKIQFTYLILGAGRQGTSAAYDLARFGQAQRILLADQNPEAAAAAAERINRLFAANIAEGITLDVADQPSLDKTLSSVDAALSAVPYYNNLEITRAAISARTHLCDLGGNTQIVWNQLKLDEEAREAGVSVVPDCGMGPGLNNTLGAYAIELLDRADEVYLYDGGLPQEPVSPWNYQLTFHINGLTNEMDGRAVFLRDGQIVEVDTLSEPEIIEFSPLGKLEADVTSGGTSTAPWTFRGQLKAYENKTLRYPGHFEWLRAYKTLGLFSEEPIRVDGQTIIPRMVYHALLEPKITSHQIRDVCVMRTRGVGEKDERRRTVTIDLIDEYDDATGFTAMERLTGWHAAIMLIFQAVGKVRKGCIPVESAVPAGEFMRAVRERGIRFEIFWD
jgi:lysine 6-dehydrogenase